MLIYWENITNTLASTFSILFAWFLAKLNFSFTWCLIILVIVGAAFKRNLTRLRRKIRHDVHTINSLKRMDTDTETVEFLNLFLQKFWLLYEPSLSDTIKSSVNSILDGNKPSFLEDLRLSTFTLGSEAPRIEGIKTYPRTDEDVLMMDWDLSFQPFDEDDASKRLGTRKNSKIILTAKLGKSIASIPLPILLKEVGFRGLLRIHIKFSTIFPHIKLIEIGFLDKPKIDFILRPLKSMDIMDLPGLNSFLNETIKYQLENNIVDPNRITLQIEEMMNSSTSDEPVGILSVSVYEARSLRNVESLGGISDPYASLKIGSVVISKTKVVESSLNPKWDETFDIVIYKSQLSPVDKADEFSIELFDFNNLQRDKSMGQTPPLKLSRWILLMNKISSSPLSISADQVEEEEVLEELEEHEKNLLIKNWGLPNEKSDLWKSLYATNTKEDKKQGGEVHFDLNYIAIPKRKSKLDISSGIVSVTIHQLKDLSGAHKNSNLFIIAELNTGLELARTAIRKKSQAPIWEKSFDFFTRDIESSKIILKIRDEKDLSGSVAMGYSSINVKEVIQNKVFYFNQGCE